MSDIKPINNMLVEIMRQDKGIKDVILVDNSGLTIANASRISGNSNLDNLGAIASAIFMASQEQGNGLEVGNLDSVTSEFDGGKIFVRSCGTSVLCIVSSSEVNIGMVRMMSKKHSPRIEQELAKFFDADIGAEDESDLEDVLGSLDDL